MHFLGFVADCEIQFKSSEIKTEEITKSVHSRIEHVQFLFEVKALYFMTLVKTQLWGLGHYRDTVIKKKKAKII